MKKVIFLLSILFYAFCPISGQNAHYMLDFPVNIRTMPNTSSAIIGRLNLHDEIEIIERTNIKQTIEEIEEYWSKIKYNDIIGYVWGGYIATGRFIIDIDNNGINDHIYYRKARTHRSAINPSKDLFIYMNNNNTKLSININKEYNQCYIFKLFGITYVKLGVFIDIHDLIDVDVYRLEQNGNIYFHKRISQTIGVEGDDFFSSSLEES